MRASRSRLIAVAVVLLAVAGAAFAAGSFASGRAPAAAHRAAALAQRTFVSAATGNDANPCTRTAPCRNFAAAIAQTSSGGEVVVLDSGGYGTVTITQAVSIVAPDGVYAGISVFAGTGITVNAGASDVVTIRGLTLNGLGGSDGIDYFSGAALSVQDSVFKNFAVYSINAATGASADLFVEDSLVTRSNNIGIYIQTSAGKIRGTIDRCRVENGASNAVFAGPNSNVLIRDSVASGNASVGFWAADSTAQVDVENSLTTHNGWGLVSYGGMRVSQTTVEENSLGLLAVGGTMV